MADIENIKVGSTSYSIKDATAAHALSDIAVAGDNIEFQSGPFAEYTVVGSPTISSDYVASGFSDSKYLTIPNYLNNASSSFELVTAIKKNAFNNNYGIIDTQQSPFGIRLTTTDMGYVRLRIQTTSSNVFDVDITSTTSINVPSQNFYIKVTYNSSIGYGLYISTDGENWNTEGTSSETARPYSQATNLLYIGRNSVSGYAFNGSIYLADTYIDVNNGSYRWDAVVTNNKPKISATLPTVDQTYNSSSANAQSGVAISGAGFLKNTATGTRSYAFAGAGSTQGTQSLSIGYSATTGVVNYAVAIGSNPTASGSYSIALGYRARATGGDSVYIGSGDGTSTYQASGSEAVSIGHYSKSTNERSIALGGYAAATANYAIQIGPGTNSTANSFSVATSVSNNYTLLESDGTIPDARLKSDVLINTATATGAYSIGGNTQTTNLDYSINIGYGTGSRSAGVAIGKEALVSNSTSGGVAVGKSAFSSGWDATAVGVSSQSGGAMATALGCNANASGSYSIQIGRGTNSTANTLSVGLSSSDNYTLLNSDGTIPGPRMSLQGSGAPTTSTAGTVGQFYVDTTNETGYMCVAASGGTYTWKQITV